MRLGVAYRVGCGLNMDMSTLDDAQMSLKRILGKRRRISWGERILWGVEEGNWIRLGGCGLLYSVYRCAAKSCGCSRQTRCS